MLQVVVLINHIFPILTRVKTVALFACSCQELVVVNFYYFSLDNSKKTMLPWLLRAQRVVLRTLGFYE